ncbi:hypothetical protein [Amycolatopsis sp.]|nr:hypothetical protein [Amycolatopsis sp.]
MLRPGGTSLLLEQAGLVVRRQERLKAGTVERVAAVKPVDAVGQD